MFTRHRFIVVSAKENLKQKRQFWKNQQKLPLNSNKTYSFPQKRHQWPFYHFKIHKIKPKNTKNTQNALIFSWCKVRVFTPSLPIFWFLVRLQIQKVFFSSCSHILMDIPNMNYYNYFVTIFHAVRSTNLQTRLQNKK